MQIVCPNCTTSYQVSAEAIGENGRSVRCVRCQSVWFAAPAPMVMAAPPISPADEPVHEEKAFTAELGTEPAAPPEPDPPAASEAAPAPPVDEPETTPSSPEVAVETAPAALADIPIPIEDAPSLVPAVDGGPPISAEVDNGPPDVESVAARRARNKARQRRSRWRVPLPAVIVVLVAACVVLLGWRKDVVRYAPQLASFYNALGLPVNLRGLTFTDVKIGNEIHDGVPVLVVEGTIVNNVSTAVDVPRLRFALRNATGAEVYSWTAVPTQPVLQPGETLPFRSRLASPPAEGHDIQVRFFTRRDAVAGLR